LREVAVTVQTITWSHVPPGTQLEVSVAPATGACISSGDIFMQDKGSVPVKQWSDRELQPGPAVERLKEGVDTTVDIRVVSAGTTAADGKVSATLRETSSGTVLDSQSREFDVAPRTHDLVRIFADADAVVAAASAAAPVEGGRRATRRASARGGGRKRGK
jgi:hypothetical protein